MRALIAILLLAPHLAYADPGIDLVREVISTGRLCAYGKGPTERQDCFVRAAPDRCEKEARAGVMGNAMLFAQLRACIISCGNAGTWSSTVGECRRDLVADDAPKRVAMLDSLNCYADEPRNGIGMVREECLSIVEDN